MPATEAQKRAIKKYYEKNKECILDNQRDYLKEYLKEYHKTDKYKAYDNLRKTRAYWFKKECARMRNILI
jgi:hypothetical protein